MEQMPNNRISSKNIPFKKILNFKLIAYAIGILLWVEGGMLLLCMGVSLFYQEECFKHFLYTAGINALIGSGLIFYGRGADTWMTRKDGYFIVTLTWLMFTILGMLPFLMSGEIPSVTNAFFETISGFTTTGATILDNIEAMPHGMLFWRNLTQWIGGLGIMCFTIALLPVFGGGNLQLFSAEATGVIHDKIHPKISINTKLIWTTYIILTGICTALLYVAGMDIFDAVCHSFSTIGTGGYSTKQTSVSYWESPSIEYIIGVFMIISSLNYSLMSSCLQGKFRRLFQNGEVRWFLGSVAVLTIIITGALFFKMDYSIELAFRKAFFQVSTIHSSSGFASDDYNLWPKFTWILLIFAMMAGGCTGSTAGGMKNMRIMIVWRSIKNEFKRLIHPNAVLAVRINKQVIPQTLLNTVSTFIVFFLACSLIGTILLMALDINFLEAFSCTISALGNTGPALGEYGPAYTMNGLPEAAKWIMSFLMLIGRLELFCVLILFSKVFWNEW